MAVRKRVTEFSESPAAADLGHRLKFLADTYGEECALFRDGEWAWSGLLGADLGWADYPISEIRQWPEFK